MIGVYPTYIEEKVILKPIFSILIFDPRYFSLNMKSIILKFTSMIITFIWRKQCLKI